MIRIITGGLFSGTREWIQSELKREIFDEHKYGRAFYLVPEQQVLSSERDLCELLPPEHPLCVDATSFTRLANTVFRELGGLAQGEADALRRALLIYKAISKKSDALYTMKRGSVNSSSVDKTISAIRKMQSLSITSEALKSVSDSLTEGGRERRLCEKLHDLSLIMSTYSELLQEKYKSADDTLTKLNARLRECGRDFFKKHRAKVYIEGFTSFTEPQYTVIGTLVSTCDVDIVLTLPSGTLGESFEYTELRNTLARLTRLARHASADVKLIRLPDAEVSSPLMKMICDNIWRSSTDFDKYSLHNEDNIRIFEAESPYEECDFVAADIKRRVMEGGGGVRYSDFAILMRDVRAYTGILNVSFASADIPLFISQEDSISSFEITRLISSALSAICSGYSREDIMTYAKCSLSPICDGDADRLDEYVHKWQLDKSAFVSRDDWTMSPFGYDTMQERESWQDTVDSINATRRALMAPLTELCDAFATDPSVLGRTRALYSFIERLDIYKKLCELAGHLKESGFDEEARATERMYSLMLEALDGVAEVLGELTVDDREYLSIIELALAQTKFGSIPSYTDQVVAGNVDLARFKSKPHVYIIGANQGVLPARVNDDGYFLENELRAIEEMLVGGAAPENGEERSELKRKSAMEYFYISRAISVCKESLTVLYPTLSASFGVMNRSDLVSRIGVVTGGVIAPLKISSLPLKDRIYVGDYALLHLKDSRALEGDIRTALTKSGYADKLALADASLDNSNAMLLKETVDSIYGGKVVTSPSGLESYRRCPMRHFLSRNIYLDEGERASFGSNGIGSFVHGVLELFFKDLKDRSVEAGTLTADERRTLTVAAVEKYVDMSFDGIPKSSVRIKHIVERLTRFSLPIVDGFCEEFAGCDFLPTFFELPINKHRAGQKGHNPRHPDAAMFTTDDGHSIYVYGNIDRVDTFIHDGKAYVRVVDYKTGKKDFSPKDLSNGENLQMFLYLKAICDTASPEFKREVGISEDTPLIPAGVIYAKTEMAEVTVRADGDAKDAVKDAIKGRSGMLLDDQASIDAMNRSYVPIKFTKDGGINKKYLDKLYTLRSWDSDILEALSTSVTGICKEMLSGQVSATPLKKKGSSSVCDYCKFQPICRKTK
ncbi:MAG: PD-(D/E)XK nuclease family protein [Clostridia bacterium]|nr:PD-(D/E)XK nuclease family protein [Clostridia bacterium]